MKLITKISWSCLLALFLAAPATSFSQDQDTRTTSEIEKEQKELMEKLEVLTKLINSAPDDLEETKRVKQSLRMLVSMIKNPFEGEEEPMAVINRLLNAIYPLLYVLYGPSGVTPTEREKYNRGLLKARLEYGGNFNGGAFGVRTYFQMILSRLVRNAAELKRREQATGR